jgi:hypothetical protein
MIGALVTLEETIKAERHFSVALSVAARRVVLTGRRRCATSTQDRRAQQTRLFRPTTINISS